MASIYGGASGSGWKLRLDYTVTQDRAANTSSLRLRLYLYANTTGSYNLEKDSAYYVLQGQKVYQTYQYTVCLLYTSPSPRDLSTSRMPSSA